MTHLSSSGMGEQQLLLLVLGIVIVGLAVVVGIQAFGDQQKTENADAMANDTVRIASDAQAWNLKPAAFGGGNGSFAGISMERLGYRVDDDDLYLNANASYRLTETDSSQVTITACNGEHGNQIVATVDGTAPDDIEVATYNVSTCD